MIHDPCTDLRDRVNWEFCRKSILKRGKCPRFRLNHYIKRVPVFVFILVLISLDFDSNSNRPGSLLESK